MRRENLESEENCEFLGQDECEIIQEIAYLHERKTCALKLLTEENLVSFCAVKI